MTFDQIQREDSEHLDLVIGGMAPTCPICGDSHLVEDCPDCAVDYPEDWRN